ncbi:hypothetical protein F383_33410 [Gossypium arboreum]|uniref:Uncharacterized protein n=1 Tax=Gossypium arboreum TaxID=29729 RepID=A0A0B0PKF7_GOSAR|nr:hypothetical protein F383_33410 [Gossypium arboreum]
MVLHEITYRILCHNICILTILMVRTGLFERRNTADAFTIPHIHLLCHSFHFKSI